MSVPFPITFGPQVCTDLTSGSAREWLVPDGTGGYAMGTVTGLRTRRYHGLLVVAGMTPASRMLGLASLDAVLTLPSGARVRLGCHEWSGGAVEPRGHLLLTSFALIDGVPRWRWRIGDVVIEREIAMVHGRPSVAVVHRLIAGGPVRLALEALCAWRDAHGAQSTTLDVAAAADGCVVEGAYRISGPGFTPAGEWFRGARYREEAARGLQDQEDLWYAGSFHAALDRPGATASCAAWAGTLDEPPPPATDVVDAARTRNRAVVAAARPADPVQATLALAADAFVVRTRNGPDVVAGYPWFGAWSRDTMISYEGLFLATGRASLGRDLLRAYAATLSEGMLANTADTGGVEYNTVDGTLWFLHAVDRHVTVTGDTDLAAELRPALAGVIEHHLAGTRYGIRADPADGLLVQGAPGTALTWMDARVDGVPVTARSGKAVDVNAVWINGLATLGSTFAPVHARARESFARAFPTPSGLLRDVLGDHPLRPNQLLAWSLPHAPLRPDPAVLARIGAALLTPAGLRSQAPGTPGYHGRHRGGPAERDTAYHTGTVWPWLTGPYVSAWRRLGVEVPDVLADAERHLTEFGLGSISETAEGDAPHDATGCPFQAWSVAEHLRVRKL
ncbi:amylo-alpha-1,6-glucosidase [Actinoplanes regularis]|uniref:Glycogen debranching enzyme, putative n=1 Tax=Actinoplanes regularis TaxID=52697 RepID=A0A238WA73_9ACTN|nr:amylo-alpha-1,6-glucosidase [Actinoplanes regularis]GIE85118.1 glycogen debranching protein [Actinoplanes regularis]SNR43281.1 glycogen debranching enzyme, putative [Actinoplanes regularis]